MSMFVVLGRSERIGALSGDNNVGGDAVSTLKPDDAAGSRRGLSGATPLVMVALTLLALLPGGCTPTHDWVGPGDGVGLRGADMSACHQEAALRTDRALWFQRQQLQRDAWWSRRASDRAMANARLHQLEMLSALDRQRAFDDCMQERGYRLQKLTP
jgi:hypothetical protein